METKFGAYSRSNYNTYSKTEAKSLLGETMKQIFCDEPPNDYFVNPCLPAFRPQHWTVIALTGNFYSTHRQIEHEPDSVLEVDVDSPAQSTQWITIPLNEDSTVNDGGISSGSDPNLKTGFELPAFIDEFDPLWEILAEDGASEIFAYSPWESEVTAVSFEPNRRAMGDALDDLLVYTTGWLLDRTATWGVHSAMDEYSFIGGEPTIMKRFIEKAGGLDVLQTRMKYRMAHHFSREGEASERWLNKWYNDYELMGWPWPYPVFPKGQSG